MYRDCGSDTRNKDGDHRTFESHQWNEYNRAHDSNYRHCGIEIAKAGGVLPGQKELVSQWDGAHNSERAHERLCVGYGLPVVLAKNEQNNPG
jgi:hypothetical protein